jgi:hypothetical protein
MTTKIGVYLTDAVAKQLKIAARQPGATKSGIVNEALLRHLDPAPEKDQREEVLDRLGQLAKRLRQVHREVEVVAEILALFVRYFLTINPPLPRSEQHAAETLGRQRYEVFVKQIAKRIASESQLVAEVMETIVTTRPDLVARATAGATANEAAAHNAECAVANGAMPQHPLKPLEEASRG